jgi:hypothetical protein
MHCFDLSSNRVAFFMHSLSKFNLAFVLKILSVDRLSQNGDLVNNMNEPTKSIWASIWLHFRVMAPISANCSVVYAFFGSDSNLVH